MCNWKGVVLFYWFNYWLQLVIAIEKKSNFLSAALFSGDTVLWSEIWTCMSEVQNVMDQSTVQYVTKMRIPQNLFPTENIIHISNTPHIVFSHSNEYCVVSSHCCVSRSLWACWLLSGLLRCSAEPLVALYHRTTSFRELTGWVVPVPLKTEVTS